MRRRSRRGTSLVEVAMASGITMFVLFTAISMFLFGMQSWLRGQGRIDAQSGSQRAVRQVSEELREAMSVAVDGNGNGLTYRRPVLDGGGNYSMPITWDNVIRRIEINGTNLRIVTNGTPRIICSNVILTDPQNGNAAYRVFIPGVGTITRSLTVMVVAQKNSYVNENIQSRSRETIYLRNIPELTQ